MELDEARTVLIENFRNHPECIDSEQSARGLVMDSIPQRQAEKNILITLYHEGFIDDLRGSDVPQLLKNRYKLILTNEYGYSKSISLWCIDTWIIILRDALNEQFGTDTGVEPDDIISDTADLIAVKSEYERLLEEINNLKGVITALTAERDDLKYHICRDLAAEYNSRIGEIELQVLNAKLRVLELKRTVEILQAWINRQERASEKKAREQAKKEYKEFEDDLNRKAEEAKNANQYKEDETQKEEEWEKEQEEREQAEDGASFRKYRSRNEEMKALYRKIVKALHPDMNPNITDAMKQMFQEAVDAYNKGVIDKLREIAALIDEGNLSGDGFKDSQESVGKLKEIIEGLKLRIDELMEEIEEIKTSFPYTMKDFLEDDKKVTKRQKELTKLLYEYGEQIEELEKRIDEMLGKSVGNGKKKEK